MGLVPEPFDLVDEWRSTTGESMELYTDRRETESMLILASDEPPEEHVATFFHACGVLRATVWHGTGVERAEAWRVEQVGRAAAAFARLHAEPRESAA